MKYILAGETGGTKTALSLLTHDGEIIASVRCKGVASLHEGTLPIKEYLEEGLMQFSVALQDIVHCYFSLGGPNQTEVENTLRGLLPFAEIKVGREADGDLALFCAEKFECSACLLAGTGTVAVGDGKTHRYFAGGWGPELDDFGGGTRIGFEALSAALKAFDRRVEKTMLIKLLDPYLMGKDITTFSGRMALKKELTALTRARIASFLPFVAECATKGDVVARSILDSAICELLRLASAVTPLDDPGKYKGCLCLGGIFMLGEEFNAKLKSEYSILRPDYRLIIAPDGFSLGSGVCDYAMVEYRRFNSIV